MESPEHWARLLEPLRMIRMVTVNGFFPTCWVCAALLLASGSGSPAADALSEALESMQVSASDFGVAAQDVTARQDRPPPAASGSSPAPRLLAPVAPPLPEPPSSSDAPRAPAAALPLPPPSSGPISGSSSRAGIFPAAMLAMAAAGKRATRPRVRPRPVPRWGERRERVDPVIAAAPGMQAAAAEIVRAAVGGERAGAALVLRGFKVQEVDLQDVSSITAQRNLAIKVAAESEVQARANTLAARANFRPYFGFALSYTQTDTYARQEWIVRRRFDGEKMEEQFQDFEAAFSTEKTVDPVIGIITVDGEQVVSSADAIYPFTVKGDWDQASWRTQSDAWNFSLGASQNLPWGANIGISLAAAHNNPEYPEDINYGLFHHANWSASLAASLTVPLPFGKEFGRYATNDWRLRDDKMYETQTRATTRSSVNSNLAAAQVAYWTLVGAAENLRVTRLSRMLTAKLVEQVEKLVTARRSTPYALSQIKARLEQTKYVEELSYQNYVVSTNNLRRILNISERVVFLPKAGYRKLLEESTPVNVEQALRKALANNPDLAASRIALERKREEYKYWRKQSRPDFYLYGMLSFSQDTSEFGYPTLADALDEVIPGDKEDHYIGIAFSIPWGNNPARAKREQAKEDLRITADTFEQTRNRVQEQTKNALAALLSARGQVKAAIESRKLADAALQAARTLAAAGRITQFETIAKVADALNADRAWVDAVVQRKIAEVQLLAAQGLLADTVQGKAGKAGGAQ